MGNAITIFIEIEDIPIILILLQQETDPIHQFNLGPFEFHLLQNELNDVCRYRVSRGNHALTLIVIGIHTTNSCGVFGNVDFVNFIWDSMIICFRRHSITLIPPVYLQGRLGLCLQHYMVRSSGWDFITRCVLSGDI
jgi:hypothetical protein